MASIRPICFSLSRLPPIRLATRLSPCSELHAPPSTLRTPSLRTHSSVSASELTHFSALASSWWDPMGPSRILHLMNPLRHEFIASCLADSSPAQSPNDAPSNSPNLHYLDVGCGGGIFAESLARTIPLNDEPVAPTPTRAASITAIDPSTTLIQIARDHARTDPTVETHLRSGRFRYLNTTLEDILSSSTNSTSSPTTTSTSPSTSSSPTLQPPTSQFDMVTLFEVLEHIDPTTSSPQTFLTNCLRALKPGGWLIGSTIARTVPSFLLNRVIAEAPWPVGVVPRGTHEWSKFVNPPEVHSWVQEGLMRAADSGTGRGGPAQLEGMRWKCVGAVYVPGFGWKMVSGAEDWGNYFWAVKKGPSH